MILAEAYPPPAMKLAGQVAASVGLMKIQPRQVVVESRLKPTVSQTEPEFRAALNQRPSRFELREGDRVLDVYVGVDVRFYAGEGEVEKAPDAWVAQIGLEYLLTYRLPPEPMPADVRESGLAAFSKVNARLTCWPYIRQEVSHLASEIGIPCVLPTLLLKSEDLASPQAQAGTKPAKNPPKRSPKK
jgi:hypothetical protein